MGTQCFRVVFFCYGAVSGSNVQIFGRILSRDRQIKATEQYFTAVLFITLYRVVLTFESVDEILKCDHSNESYCLLCF